MTTFKLVRDGGIVAHKVEAETIQEAARLFDVHLRLRMQSEPGFHFVSGGYDWECDPANNHWPRLSEEERIDNLSEAGQRLTVSSGSIVPRKPKRKI